jgi:hypothetical protein
MEVQGALPGHAAAVGMTSPIWPTQKTTEKVVVLGLR